MLFQNHVMINKIADSSRTQRDFLSAEGPNQSSRLCYGAIPMRSLVYK